MEITRMLRVLCTAALISPQVALYAVIPIQFAVAAVNQRNYASKGQFPHHVAIVLDDTSPCSGTLIKEQWVLTAAQCVDNAVKWTVYAGTNNMLSASEEGRQILTTRRAYPSPGYNFPEYDLALLKTPTKFQLSTYVKPAVLPSTLDAIRIGGSAAVTGYQVPGVPGSTTESENNNLWYIDDLKIVERTECDKAFGRTFKYNHICVVGPDDLLIAEGDLGSPLLSRNSAGELTPIGVASIVSQPGTTGTATHFVFFSVPDVLAWIKWATDSANWNVYNEE